MVVEPRLTSLIAGNVTQELLNDEICDSNYSVWKCAVTQVIVYIASLLVSLQEIIYNAWCKQTVDEAYGRYFRRLCYR